jgi:hypothetical protein
MPLDPTVVKKERVQEEKANSINHLMNLVDLKANDLIAILKRSKRCPWEGNN